MKKKKILLYYKYVHSENLEAIQHWQKSLCQALDLKGRIILAHEGINGTVAGSVEATQAYIDAMNKHALFGDIDFKESLEDSECEYFSRLRVVLRKEIVHFGVVDKKITSEYGGKYLTPDEAHKLLQRDEENLVVFDARNYNESRVGAFKNAIKPDINYFRELPMYFDQNIDQFKNKKVLMYCTGGIRCEKATAYLKKKNVAQEIYQIEGGIQRYIEKYPDGFFRGKNYVFDNRVTVKVNNDILGSCDICGVACDEFTNCLNASCNKHFIGCMQCLEKFDNACSQACEKLIANKRVAKRPKPNTIVQRKCNVKNVIFLTTKK